jgi:alkylhydroperoxidase family enzyme
MKRYLISEGNDEVLANEHDDGSSVVAEEAVVHDKHGGPIRVLTAEEAWGRLRITAQVPGTPLPAWARALAGSLPQTTAALLRLDFLHRACSPLDPVLRGKMRWVAARANRCAYSEAYSAADLRRAGLNEGGLRELQGVRSGLPTGEQEALAFAEKLMTAPQSITDQEMAELINLYSAGQVLAMVLLLAHATFLDRLVLSLRLALEAEGPLMPLQVSTGQVDPEANSDNKAPRRAGQMRTAAAEGKRRAGNQRGRLPLDRLQQMVGRKWSSWPRIRIPSPKEGREELVVAWFSFVKAVEQEIVLAADFAIALRWQVASARRCVY